MTYSVPLRTEGLAWDEEHLKYEIRVHAGCLTLRHKSDKAQGVSRVSIAMSKHEMVDLRHALGLALKDMGCPSPF